MIAIGLSPNTQIDDAAAALRVLLMPWQWKRGSGIKHLEEWFCRYFRAPYAISFDSGRSCEYAILKTLGIGWGDEILIQAFTCVAVPNSILWTGAVPIYVDVDETGNIDPIDLERKITSRSRAIIVQHTLGIVADIEQIANVAKKHKLVLIEDCAHALGVSFDGKKVGAFGDFAFFSFGRDKVISCVFGGMAIAKNKKQGKMLRDFQRKLAFPSFAWVFQQLCHPIAVSIILPLYNLFVGKMLLLLLQKLRLLGKPVEEKEKKGKRPAFYPNRLPNAQASLAAHQVKKLVEFNKKRWEIGTFYQKALQNLPVTLPKLREGDIVLRYNLQVLDPESIYQFAKKRGILLGRWYSNVIDPQGVDFSAVGYSMGSCPKAEELARKSLNLPTYPRMGIEDAHKVVAVLKEYFANKAQ